MSSKTKALVDTVRRVAGPFSTEDEAAEWLYQKKNYSPSFAICKGFDGRFYVGDMTQERQRWANEQRERRGENR